MDAVAAEAFAERRHGRAYRQQCPHGYHHYYYPDNRHASYRNAERPYHGHSGHGPGPHGLGCYRQRNHCQS